MKTILFASDFHGSSLCWDKLLRSAKQLQVDAICVGGDVSGKALVPIIDEGGGQYKAEVSGAVCVITNPKELETAKRSIEDVGRYWVVISSEEALRLQSDRAALDALTNKKICERFKEWIFRAESQLAETSIQLYVIFGNDDALELDDVLRECQRASCRVLNPEVDNCRLGEYDILGLSRANTTPFQGCPRDVSEKELASLIDAQVQRVSNCDKAIFLFHPPPFDSGIDSAQEVKVDSEGTVRLVTIGGLPNVVPVGSRAVRNAIELHCPLLGLHGHIHESPGTVVIDKTMCVNPGSLHADGTLQGVWIALDGEKVKGVRPVMV